MLTADLHTHTRYSHGKGTPEDNVRAAIACGLPRVAIAEHGPGHIVYGVRMSALLRLRREIDRLQDVYGAQIKIEMGLELNLMGDGLTDMPKDAALFDFVLLGFHRGIPPQDKMGWRMSCRVGLGLRTKEHAREHAQAYARAMDRTPKLLAITHPGVYIPVDIALLAREAARHGVALEINEKHNSMTLEHLRQAAQEDARFLISSDAHRAESVGVCSRGVALAREAGVIQNVINWVE